MAKGGNFEREVATALSLWWSDGKRSDIFYRSHASGGRFTMRRKSGKDTALQGGDITASDPIGEPLIKVWSIECKSGYGKNTKTGVSRWDILDLIDSQQKETVIEKMWAQCVRDAELTNREPILIFRRNGRKPCVMLDYSYWITKANYKFALENQIQVKHAKDGSTKTIMPLTVFLAYISPKNLGKTPTLIKKRICKV